MAINICQVRVSISKEEIFHCMVFFRGNPMEVIEILATPALILCFAG